MNQDDDSTMKRIREIRHTISEECSHDPQQMVEYYLELQKGYRGRLLTTEYEEALEVSKPTSPFRLSTRMALQGEM